ncbi:nicotinamide-nucleotide amidase [Tamaricihabitans halophyticus]|uniref:Nicotinamide-nucleotide amidase n=1 Tax=Tamaricihabitans halophyticus TaxID=1262583 RepID=A0A4R2PY05_9PSEU|nr:CinA family protein [Tamaricihabitans halophyticus]TCP41122.1 nicotinamide-nucleotide amidase [Tamaricihabitans halophyticus]
MPLFGASETQLKELVAQLTAAGRTVACAESLTGGLVCAALTSVPGASAVVRGALVVYATDLKAELAGVDPTLLSQHGAVHPRVADQLAEGARRRCSADIGLGLTGVAGPDPQDGIAAGTVHLAAATEAGVRRRTLRAAGDRHAVRAAAVAGALDLLAAAISSSA